jgi:hypothetical protein
VYMGTVFLLHTIYLILSILFTWFWSSNSELSNYNLQLTGVLILVYFVFKIIPRSSNQKTSDFPSTIILNTICLLLIFSSGGINSPLFFVLSFLIFAIALLVEPTQAAISSVLLVSIFAWQGRDTLDTLKLVNLLSLILMTPIAMIFSRNYLEVLESKGKVKVLEKKLQETETDSLLWITTKAKPSLAGVLNATTDLVIYFNSKGQDLLLPSALSDKLKSIQKDLITLYSSADNLEKSIEETSNKSDL